MPSKRKPASKKGAAVRAKLKALPRPLQPEMTAIFVNSQQSKALHEQCVADIVKLYDKSDYADFCEEFLLLLRYPLSIFDKSENVDTCLDFVAKFASVLQKNYQEVNANLTNGSADGEEPEMHRFVALLVNFLLDISGVEDKAVRVRTCQLISKLLSALGENAEIDEEMFERVIHAMLERAKDKVPRVRYHAVQALYRLQDPRDKECRIIAVFSFLIGFDPSVEVRNSVLQHIAVNKVTLEHFLNRHRDLSEIVRKNTYIVISEKLTLKVLTLKQRSDLLRDGLTDPSDAVRRACETKLLPAWLKLCDNKISEFLFRVDVINNTETADLVIAALFKQKRLKELVDDFCLEHLTEEGHFIDEPTAENTFYWRHLIAHVKKKAAAALDTSVDTEDGADVNEIEEFMDRLLPPLLELADYVKSYIKAHGPVTDVLETAAREQIAQELLTILDMADTSDAAGRKHLVEVIQLLIMDPDTAYQLTEKLVRLYVKLFPQNLDEPIRWIAEAIAEFRQPLQDDSAVDADVGNEFVMSQERSDSQTLIRCLSLINNLLRCPEIRALNSTLRSILDSLLIPSIGTADPQVRTLGFRGLGLCCILDRAVANKNTFLFLQTLRVDCEQVRKAALAALFDMLLVYGFELLVGPEEEKQPPPAPSEDLDTSRSDAASVSVPPSEVSTKRKNPADELQSMLLNLLDSNDEELHGLLVEGFAKLLVTNRLYSPVLISRLILKWFNPVSKHTPRLRYCLGTFLPHFAFSSRNNQDTLEEAFMPTMRALFDAPLSSPLSRIDRRSVASFLVNLTNRKFLNEKETQGVVLSCVHGSLAIKMCNQMLTDPDNDTVECQLYARLLSTLNLEGADRAMLRDLLRLIDQCRKEVGDKLTLKLLDKARTEIIQPLFEAVSVSEGSQEVATEEETDDGGAQPRELIGIEMSDGSQQSGVANGNAAKGARVEWIDPLDARKMAAPQQKRSRALLKLNETKMLTTPASELASGSEEDSRARMLHQMSPNSSISASSSISGLQQHNLFPRPMAPLSSQASTQSSEPGTPISSRRASTAAGERSDHWRRSQQHGQQDGGLPPLLLNLSPTLSFRSTASSIHSPLPLSNASVLDSQASQARVSQSSREDEEGESAVLVNGLAAASARQLQQSAGQGDESFHELDEPSDEEFQ